MKRLSASAVGVMLMGGVSASAQTSTIDPANLHAWSQNAGWIAMRHDQPSAASGIVVSEYFLKGRAWAQNLGWIDFGSGLPYDNIRYGNTLAADCGVNHSGDGGLSGFAWSQNAGWINFGWAPTSDPNRPRIDLSSGKFTGFAWGQNTGWINLSTGLGTLSVEIADADSDGMDDSWEVEWFTKPSIADATTDHDNDGKTDAEEFIAGTNPTDPAEYLRIVSSVLDEPNETMWLTAATTRSTRFYQLSSSTDLVNWDPDTWVQGQTGAMVFKGQLKSPLEPKKFFRVSAKRPLVP